MSQRLPIGPTAKPATQVGSSMSEMYQTARLVTEFQRITNEYEQAFAKALALLPRRSEIVLELVQSGLTYRQVGLLLGISAGRVGQLVQEAPGYVPQRPPATPKSTAA